MKVIVHKLVVQKNQFNYILIVYINNVFFNHGISNPNHIFFVKYPTLCVSHIEL